MRLSNGTHLYVKLGCTKDVNVTSTLGIEIMIFIILFIIIDRIVKKKSEWLFNKIN